MHCLQLFSRGNTFMQYNTAVRKSVNSRNGGGYEQTDQNT